ncbi:MAG: molybdopterin-guanine dinucleotide biosynthesis protein B [Thiobacillaceae bacterium]
MKVLGIVGWSGSGKTTLIERLLPLLTQHGLKVSVVKQSHHDVEIDRPGKDSWRHRQAGAHEVLLSTPYRWALMHELNGAPEPGLDELLRHLSPCELVLVEGFKRADHPKLEVWRSVLHKPLLHGDDPSILAVASDIPLTGLRRYDLNDVEAISRFILEATQTHE